MSKTAQILGEIKNNITSMSISTFNLVLAIWLAVVLNINFYSTIKELTPYTGLSVVVFLIATVCIVIAVYSLFLQFFSWKWTAKILAILLVVIGGFSSYFVNSLGVVITSDQVQNMMQTDPAEAQDLLSLHLIVWIFFVVVLPVVFIIKVRLKQESQLRLVVKKLIYSLCSVGVLAGLLFTFYIDYAAIFREHRELKGMISPQNAIASTLSYYRKKAPKKDLPLVTYGEDAKLLNQINNNGKPKLMVLVVGETARAESFSLNGYGKNTNPKLSQQDLINFSQVSSCGTATAVSVPCMFSGMSREQYDEQLASHREGLLDIAQRAGYKVTWIDNNSGCKGVCDRVELYEPPKELKAKWCDAESECMDEILIDSLKQYISTIPEEDTTPRLIVLHQMGSHGPAYFKRSTSEFKPFQPTCNSKAIQGCSENELINSYDNSIVYTDHVLDQLIETLKQQPKYTTAMWYLSDHGESTGEKGLYLHGAPYNMAPSQQTHVPMLMWFSANWKSQNSQQITCLNEQKNQALSQDNLFPTMLSLIGVQTKVSTEKNDMLKQCSTKSRV